MAVEVSNADKTKRTFALLDDGSTITLISKRLEREIGAKGQPLRVALRGINDREAVDLPCEKVSFTIRGASEAYKVRNAIAISELRLPAQTLSGDIVRHVAKVESVFTQPYENARPEILIGQDNWGLIASLETRAVRSSSLAVTLTPLGWTVHGVKGDVSRRAKITACARAHGATDNHEAEDASRRDAELHRLIKEYFLVDDFGVRPTERPSARHKRAFEILNRTTKRVGNAWETGLLWKDDVAPRIDNKATALRDLVILETKLDRKKEYAAIFYAEMQRLIDMGYAKKVEGDAIRARYWYLSYFGVTNVNKPGRVRIVQHASKKTEGVSLNDQLDTGPDLLRSLAGVMMRFRLHAVAVMADISDMYMRVQVTERDRGAQRFLWRGADRKREPDVYEMTCLIFGAKSSQCSAIYVKDKNADSFARTKPDAVASIKRDSYADDFLASRPTVNEAAILVRDVIEINASANFPMHGWASNDARAIEPAPLETRSKKSAKTHFRDQGNERVLGMFWETTDDTLGFNVGREKVPKDIIDGKRKPTKREFLGIIMSVYDPLGLLSPFTLKSKILLQEIWRSGVGWDEPIRDEEYKGWVVWLEALRGIESCRVPRCLTPKTACYSGAQLHAFSDASSKAFAAAVYLRVELPNGGTHVALVMGKSRVAPLKPLSIPRLELQAALLAARLVNTVEKELAIKIERRLLWSDSITVIRWIKSEPITRQTYVSHRLGEISELTTCAEWRWVPTKVNPADLATRWKSETVRETDPWFVGPDFLRKSEANWPVQSRISDAQAKNIDNLEARKAMVYVVASTTLSVPITAKIFGWQGLLAIARRVRGFWDRWRGNRRDGNNLERDVLENFWFRTIQSDYFSGEILALSHGKTVKKSSKIANFKPFIDAQGILRAEGRVTKLHDECFNNQPIILAGEHPATRLLIKECHCKYYHASSDTVVNELRQKFHIVGLRKALRSIISKCVTCKKQRGKPPNPMMASLPAGRLAYRVRAFAHCGIDYFGPMFVKIGRRREKRWGVLFTCLTTRAIHLDLADSLTSSAVIMAIQRLAARRGCPKVMYSDNGTNFRGACRELKDEVNRMSVNEQRGFALRNGMKWLFNPPDAPHMGGAWERLIRSVKTALRAILNDQAPAPDVLYTVLTEIEHSVNSRPLTHVSVDPRDNEALTPNHFLIGCSSGAIDLGKYDAESVCLRKHWRVAQQFADSFWKRWLREYLPTLLPRKKWAEQGQSVAIGDVVIIADMQAPRNNWKRGIVVEIHTGADGVIRVAKVRTNNSEYVRPVHKLIKLISANELRGD